MVGVRPHLLAIMQVINGVLSLGTVLLGPVIDTAVCGVVTNLVNNASVLATILATLESGFTIGGTELSLLEPMPPLPVPAMEDVQTDDRPEYVTGGRNDTGPL